MSARVASVAAGAAFLGLLGLVAFGWPPMREWDRALSEQARVAGREHPDVIATLRILTDAAATIPFLAAGVALTVGFIIIREYGSAKRAALVTALVPAIWGLLHAVLSRPRPVDGFVTVASSGFPSGHTGHATAFGLLVVTLVARRLGSGGRIPILLAAVVFALFMGVTRVVLLAHWPSDVIGGWLLGIAVVGFVSWAVPAATLGPGSPPVPDSAAKASPGSG